MSGATTHRGGDQNDGGAGGYYFDKQKRTIPTGKFF